ncbi:MAG: rane protein [Chthonomonadaceae bacterium]|nr:rane protein [Chthonomonadaceae bacterium]
MNGFGLLNAGLWPWLLALSLPILIHLLTRRTHRTVTLPTFRFLQRSLAQQSQVFKLRRWLLLALRMALLLFLVLAFLKPTRTAPLAAKGGRHALVIVLDRSLSMGYAQGGVESLARVRSETLTLLDDLHPGDVADVILAGATPQPTLPRLSGDFGTLRQAVKSAQANAERGDMPAAVAQAAELLAKADAPDRTLVLASDFQRTNWADVTFDSLPAGVKLVTVSSESGERDNAAVTGLKLRPAVPVVGEEAQVVAEVWNSSPRFRSLPVTLTATMEEAAALPPQSSTLNLPPYTSGTVSFPTTFPEARRYRFVARIPADGLPADDSRSLTADLRHAQTVVLLTDEALNGSPTGAYFLSRALNPVPDQPGGIRVLARHATELTEADLKSCDAVLLEAVTTMPADRLPMLAKYVASGGTLLVFAGGPNFIGQMQALAHLGKNGDGLPFLPQSALDVSQHGKGYLTLTEARYDSPLLKLFKSPDAADLGKIHFTRLYLTTEPDKRAEVLLKFEDGTPAAARRNFGAGSVLVCNFSTSPADSDLPRQEFFPPLLHEFLKGLTDKGGDRREFFPGGSASATLDADQVRGTITCLDPNSASERVMVDKPSGGVIVDHVDRLGFHTVLANGKPVASLSVNAHPDESDLRTIDPRELQSKRAKHAAYAVHAGAVGAAAELDSLRHDRPLWPYCLLAVLLFLLLEHAVAAFGGHARLRAAAPTAKL